MRWVLFVVCIVLFLAAFVLGLWLGNRKNKRIGLVTVGVCLGFILLRVFFRYVPTVEFVLFPFDAYAVIRPWWALPFALAVVGVGATRMSTPLSRKGVGVFGLLLFLVCGQRLWATARFDPATMTGVVGRTGVCEQTTGYTCGASAAATLLHHYGIEASEREMAERCWTNSMSGTDEFCVARGLRQKLAGTGRQVDLVYSDYDGLLERGEPAMATIRWGMMVDHWVVVMKAEPERVLVGDPLAGPQHYTKAEFLEKWRGFLMTADRVE